MVLPFPKHAGALILRQETGEWGVLAKFSALRRRRYQRREDPVDRAVDQCGPLVEPATGLAPAHLTHLLEIPARHRTGTVGIFHDATSHCVGEPLTSSLVAGEALGAVPNGLDIATANPPVGTNCCVGQLSAFAKIHYMLTRRVEDLRRLSGREKLIALGLIPEEATAPVGPAMCCPTNHPPTVTKTDRLRWPMLVPARLVHRSSS